MKCWVCGSGEMIFKRDGKTSVEKDDFLITDSRYGVTRPLYKCKECGFLQCDTESLDDLYEQLEDAEYIESSEQRLKQFDYLLKKTMPFIKTGRDILDIGAGAGMFVKLALEKGLNAKGIEPSTYLANHAISRGLPVINTSCPDFPDNSFDAVYMTDVIEHIADPLPLLRTYCKLLKPGGAIFISTPNVSSFLSRLMGKRWWCYRYAHIGYYDKKTLNLISEKAGFKLKRRLTVRWYFKAEYAYERFVQYIPFLRKSKCPKFMRNIFIPASFGDSILAVYIKPDGSPQ